MTKPVLTSQIAALENPAGGGTARNQTIDIIKAIGIILMVWCHAGGPFDNFISLFHMPIFFIASGYCWNDKNVKDGYLLKKFILRKIKTLYIPYVAWNVSNHLLNHIWVQIGFYAADDYLTWRQIVIQVIKSFFFGGSGAFAGATWFLRTLFFVSVVHALINFFTKRLKQQESVVEWIALALCGIVAQLITSFSIILPKGLHTCFSAYFVFLVGIIFKRYNLENKLKHQRAVVTIGSLCLLIVLNHFGSVGMSVGQITNIAFFAATSFLGWIMLWNIFSVLNVSIVRPLGYIGQHTMPILILHFLAFKLVTLLYCLFANEKSNRLIEFPVLKNVTYLWPCYMIVGLLIPLAINALFIKTKIHIKKGICK